MSNYEYNTMLMLKDIKPFIDLKIFKQFIFYKLNDCLVYSACLELLGNNE